MARAADLSRLLASNTSMKIGTISDLIAIDHNMI